MDFEILEKILNLFDNCQLCGKSLEINIDEDLVKILPLPRKLIIDFLSDQLISTFCRLSNDQTTLYFQNNLCLCSIDQNEGGSCHSSSCQQLHICKNYLLNNKCLEFQSSGKCSHSHSLSTNHNENILKKLNFSLKNENIFQLISRLIKLSSSINSSKLILQTINKENITNNLIDQLLDQHKSLLKDYKLLNSYTIEFIFDDNEVASMMENYFIQYHSTRIFINKNFSLDLNKSSIVERQNIGRGRGRSLVNNVPLLNNQNTFSRSLPLNLSTNEKKSTFSHRLNTTINENSSLQIKTKSPELTFLPKTETNSPSPPNDNQEPISFQTKPRFVLRGHPTKSKEKSLITYIYKKPFIDEHLCYLLGPGKRFIIEKDQCQILSCLTLGYCKVKNDEQGKDIEKELYSILPDKLNINIVNIDNHLSLIICSSIGEYIFQQNQMYYAIISEPVTVQLNIEVIRAPVLERKQSSSSIDDENTQQSLSDGKFHINTTDSSIDVISGDISQTPVDLMICISTSNNLRDSILHRAGPTTESQYKDRYHSPDALLLDGGLTAARKILFVPWLTEIQGTETTETQKSLSDLVKWCIDQAHKKQMKSISFPPIGTGQLGLDPFFVCEAMISAASERLHQYKIDVLFVIYSSNKIDDEDECYQVFKIYLDSLCGEQIKSTKVRTPTINNDRKSSKNPPIKKESIRRDVQSKRILTLSDSSNVPKDYNLLIKSLEDLMYEKIFDLSLIESSLIDRIDLLIDICLKSNVYPHIDYCREELRLCGDRDSCFQCFFNLCQDKKVYQYSYVSTENGEKIINSFISLKIDEAFAVGESNISVKDNDEIIFNIDLNKLQIRLNKDKKSDFLVKKQLNKDGKIKIPSSWSSSFLMICTIEIENFQSLECVQIFQETMLISDWKIIRVDSIENYPLYIHFMNYNKNEKSKLYFHSCSYSSVQSIIHYGLHSTNTSNFNDHSSICLTRDALNSHLNTSCRSTDAKYYLFAVELTKNDINNDLILLSNEETYLALPTYLIVYQRQKNSD